AAIGGFQRRNLDSRGPERPDPAAVGAEPRPGAAAEREHRGARLDDFLAGSADEARARNELDAELAETPEPGAQERRRLEAFREHAPARANEGLFTELRGPGAQRLGREGLDRRPQPLGGGSVAGQKPIERLGMGEVKSAATGKQELARRARACVVDDDPPPRPRDLFRRHQPRRAGADDEAGTRFVPRHALCLPRDNAGSYLSWRFRRPPDEPDALRPGRPTRGAVVQADMACAREGSVEAVRPEPNCRSVRAVTASIGLSVYTMRDNLRGFRHGPERFRPAAKETAAIAFFGRRGRGP